MANRIRSVLACRAAYRLRVPVEYATDRRLRGRKITGLPARALIVARGKKSRLPPTWYWGSMLTRVPVSRNTSSWAHELRRRPVRPPPATQIDTADACGADSESLPDYG